VSECYFQISEFGAKDAVPLPERTACRVLCSFLQTNNPGAGGARHCANSGSVAIDGSSPAISARVPDHSPHTDCDADGKRYTSVTGALPQSGGEQL